MTIRSVLIMTGVIAVFTVSCRKHKMPEDMGMGSMSIDYPAAYVVNGESNSLSVIRLTDNSVTQTISLSGSGMNMGSGMSMWPHHIYHFAGSSIHQLAIALPGMDLSAGHSTNTAGMSGKVMILDAVKGQMIKELNLPAMNHNAAFSPDGKEIWTSQMDATGKVLVYDASTYVLKATIIVGHSPAEVTFSADGSKAYVANGADDNVSIIDPQSKSVIATVQTGDNPVAAWIGYDGKMYVDNEDGKSVSIIDVASNSVSANLQLGFTPGSVAHNYLKKELWVTDPDSGKVHYWNWNALQSKWVYTGFISTAAGAHAVAFTNDGEWAYVTNQLSSSVSVVNTSSHTKIKDINVGKKPNGIVIKY